MLKKQAISIVSNYAVGRRDAIRRELALFLARLPEVDKGIMLNQRNKAAVEQRIANMDFYTKIIKAMAIKGGEK